MDPNFFRGAVERPCHIIRDDSTTIPPLNFFLAGLYRASWPLLLLIILLVFFGTSCVFALLVHFSQCQASTHQSFARVVVVCFGALVGLDPSGHIHDGTECLLLAAGLNFVALLWQGTIFAVLVTKLMAPRIRLRFTRTACVILRDGFPYLSFRVVHPQGHFCSGVETRVTWFARHVTREGEQFNRIVPIEVNTEAVNTLFYPMTLTHRVDEASPLYQYRRNLAEAPGQLKVCVSAQDEVLMAAFTDVFVFNLSDVCHSEDVHRWRDCFVPHPPACFWHDRNRACASLIRMDDAVGLDNVAVSHRRSNDGEPAETQRTRARASSDWHEPIVVQNIAVRK